MEPRLRGLGETAPSGRRDVLWASRFCRKGLQATGSIYQTLNYPTGLRRMTGKLPILRLRNRNEAKFRLRFKNKIQTETKLQTS